MHCKSGKSRAAAIVAAYLMRKYQAPLKEVFAFLLRLTRGDVQPNASFLAQLMDYELEIFGKSSMEELNDVVQTPTQTLSSEVLGLFSGSQGELDSEEGAYQVLTKLKSLMLTQNWGQMAHLNEQYRDDDFGTFPRFQLLVRRAIYQVTCMQLNFVVEKVPTPANPTTMLIYNYIAQTTKSIAESLGSSPQLGYLEAFQHASTYTLSVENPGVGDIIIDHLSTKFNNAYRQLHSGKFRQPSSHSISPKNVTSKDPSLELDVLFDDLRSSAKICFSLFAFLQADSNLSLYLEHYENALANRLLLFLPVQDSPTHGMLALEEEVASMIPHSRHMEIVRKMLADINKVPELNSNWEASLKSREGEGGSFPKLEVALLDASVWPVPSFTKSLVSSSPHPLGAVAHPSSSEIQEQAHHHHEHDDAHTRHYDHSSSSSSSCCSSHSHHPSGTIPMAKLPLGVYSAWDSFKSFSQPAEESGKMLILPHLGDAQMAATLGGKQYTLDVTTPMMLVLCGFDELEAESASVAQLAHATNLPPKLLAQTLFSLSQNTHPILIRKTKDESDPIIKEEDTFQLNENFTSKMRRFKVPNLKYPPTK